MIKEYMASGQDVTKVTVSMILKDLMVEQL